MFDSTAPVDPESDEAEPSAPVVIEPAIVYNLSGRATPAAGATGVNIDTRLALTFDGAPALAASGTLQILRKSDNAVVDTIKLGREVDALGFPGQDRVRTVNVDRLISVSGNTVTIAPHHGKLAYNTEYYITAANGVFTGAALNGTAFVGLDRASNWAFTTKAAPAASLTSVTVNDDGTADFRTVQGALDHAMRAARDTAITINVRNGTYPELLYLRNKNNVRIVGESRDGVVIQYRNYDGLNPGSGGSTAPGSAGNGGRSLFLIEAADLLALENLTLRNTMLRSTTVGSQAETLYFNNDAGRLIAKNTAFLSEQDTLQLKGFVWIWSSLVSGNVDFIWGGARAALFENSEIRSVGDTTNANNGGYLVQARVANAADKGFVFLNSRLTHGRGPGPAASDVPRATTYLARSPGSATTNDNVAFVNCRMDAHIMPVGWAYNRSGQPVPNPAVSSAARGWRERGTTDLNGAAINLASRVGGYQLTAAEAASGFANRAQIFAAFSGGWNPQP